MSEDNTKRTDDTIPDERVPDSTLDDKKAEAYEVTVKKATNEIVIKDPSSGQIVTLHGTLDIADEDEYEEEPKPLTPAQFRTALQQVDALGLTWTADSVPRLKAKKDQTDEAMYGEELSKLQREYPHLPSELSLVVSHTLTGVKVPVERVGDAGDLKQKSEIVQEVVITPEYKTEFFFKHSIKVPYLSDTDWEVVFKIAEKNVKKLPGTSYALLSLVFHHPSISGGPRKHESLTVAVNSELINKLISDFNEIKHALEYGAKVTRNVHGLSLAGATLKEDGDNVGTIPKELEQSSDSE